MNWFDLLHMVLHFVSVGAYFYLGLVVSLHYKKRLPEWLYYGMLIASFFMVYNLLYQATGGSFLFGDFSLKKLAKLPFWLIPNLIHAFVLYWFLRKT